MHIPYVFVSEINHSVLRMQNAGSAGGKTAQTAHKGLHVIHEIRQAVN
jgi:hypothetical protein